MPGINLSSMTCVVQKGKSKWPTRRLPVARHDANADATSLWLDFTFSYVSETCITSTKIPRSLTFWRSDVMTTAYADASERPTKKRKFFVDDSPDKILDTTHTAASPTRAVVARSGDQENLQPEGLDTSKSVGDGFDADMFSAVIGEQLPVTTVSKLQQVSGGNLERAINMYFDGSWKTLPTTQPTSMAAFVRPRSAGTTAANETSTSPRMVKPPPPKSDRLSRMPEKRYIGALGVAGWATRSGAVIKPGDIVKIERAKTQVQPKKNRGLRADVVVRFTTVQGQEIGRLEQESASWISALIDQGVCHMEGYCIFAPDRIRTNDTIYLQLKCYFVRKVFEAANFIKPEDNNRQTGIFEAKETVEERNLRTRQVGLVKLFNEVNMHPTKVNEAVDKHRREGILQAAEMAEKSESKTAAASGSTQKPREDGGSSPPSDEPEEGQELQQDQLDSLYKKAQSFDFDTPEMKPADTFVLDLRKYQKQALHWMVGKERDEKASRREEAMHPLWEEYAWPSKDAEDNDLPTVENQDNFYINPYSGELSLDFPVQEQNCLGGILADEMGLGKTIEMLSLIHTHTSEFGLGGTVANPSSVTNLPRLPKSSTSVERAPCTTLVVAPMSLLAQWASEAEKASKSGSLKTLVYYGSDKNVNLQTLCCEANVANAPNVIITSYGVILSEFNQVTAQGGNRGSHGGLFSLDYFRIILDEAHMIKNRQSKTAKACYELSAQHRWVLTGTPIVNRLEDLFSLVHFLRVEPWSNFSYWKTFITVPFESQDFLRALDVVQSVLQPLVLRRTKDMRTPSGEALVPLPARTIEIEKVELSKNEREVYDHIFARAKRTFSANVEAGTLMKSYTTIFAQILRLRQSCCHPILTRDKAIVAEEEDAAAAVDIANGLADDMDLDALIERFEAEGAEQDVNKFGSHVLKQIQAEADMECPICSEEPMDEQSVTGCWHSACEKCLLDYIEHQSSKGELPRCFNCREPINARDVFQVIRHDDDDKPKALFDKPADEEPAGPRVSLQRVNQLSSAKVGSLVAHLKAIKRSDGRTKSVIFSQFTSFLDLLEPALKTAGIFYFRMDGSMAQKNRAAVLAGFAERPGTCVLLLSLRAGGVGLNLTCAQRVFMMDPWWSWAVEAQAVDRVHRMGQTEEVKIIRFVVEGSIEEKMLRIQDRKKFIASSLGMMSDEEKKSQRIEDIRELLS